MAEEKVPPARPGNGRGTGRVPEPFPLTPWTRLCKGQAAGGDKRASLEKLISVYWRPVYWHIRYQWHKTVEDAKDLTQEYFATFLEKDFLAAYDRQRGRFRTFVKVSLDNFLRNQHRDAGRIVRGGHVKHLSLDVTDEPLPEVSSHDLTGDQAFDRNWASVVLRQALDRLEQHYVKRGKRKYFDAFVGYEVPEGDKPTYEELAKTLGLSVSDVRNYLHNARATFRALLRRIVAETVERGTEVDDEIEHLKDLF